MYWYTEVNEDGNTTSYCGEDLTKEEIERICVTYVPNFDGCFLRWGSDEEGRLGSIDPDGVLDDSSIKFIIKE